MKGAIPAVAAILAAPASPALALYCGVNLIVVGQSADDVLQKCGEPAYASSRLDFRPGGGWSPWLNDHPSIGLNRLYYGAILQGPTVVEEWVYNFGSTQMMPRLVFENGVLVTIRYLPYGG